MTAKPHVILFWVRKRSRKPKQIGLATAVGSAASVYQFAKMAIEGKGRFYIVEAPNAEHGRRLIKAHRTGERPEIGAPSMTTVLADGRVVAIDTNACFALAGAAESIRNWDARIARRGRVTCDESRALRSDPFASWNMANAFGKGLVED